MGLILSNMIQEKACFLLLEYQNNHLHPLKKTKAMAKNMICCMMAAGYRAA
jgi:hypothetical protein